MYNILYKKGCFAIIGEFNREKMMSWKLLLIRKLETT
jgi:hypothetical protein